MLKNIGKSIAAMTFAGLMSLPATAQVAVRVDIPLPGLEIRVGNRPPPPLPREHRPLRPGPDYVWVNGSWHWRTNDWVWVAGRWDRPEYHGAHWVQARYVHDGPGWRYEPGHWSNQHLIEGDDYRRWKAERHRNHGHDHDRDHDGG